MKILQLCHKVPFPPKDGGCIAMNNLTQGLTAQGHKVKVLAINTPKHFTDIYKLPADYLSKTNIEAVFIDTNVKIIPAFFNLFGNRSYNAERFYSQEFEQKLIELLSIEHFDIVQLESIYVSMYAKTISEHCKAKIILRAHNVEHAIWEQHAASTSNPFKKWYLNLLAKRLKKYELESSQSVDGIACITKEDAAWFKKQNLNKPVEVFPFGIDQSTMTTNPAITDHPSVFHIGSMDWLPNTEGIKWFLENAWTKISVQHPGLKLYLAGRNMPGWLKELKIKNVIIEGEVVDAYAFINSKSMMIVPLLSGGGMRVKIIEGMALGKTIISTAIGAEGIEYTNNKNILIADTATAFAETIDKCITDKNFFDTVGNNAKILATQQYNNIDICDRLIDFYHRLINK